MDESNNFIMDITVRIKGVRFIYSYCFVTSINICNKDKPRDVCDVKVFRNELKK